MIIGHENIINKLDNLIINNDVAHSYIFNGADGIGKKLVALKFAKDILCNGNQKNVDIFNNGNHPDFKIIQPDEKGAIKIEMIREMIKDVSIKPILSEYKVYVIEQSDTITVQAQNALLKTLEEPPEYVVILLITSKYYSLLSTIRSRSQKLDFNKLKKSDIIKYISDNKIDINIDDELILTLVDGSIGNIQRVIENLETINKLIEFVNIIDKVNMIQINRFSQYILEHKDNALLLLDYLQKIIFFKNITNNSSQYIKIIEEAKRNILSNINFEICIDRMLISIWEVDNV